MSKSIKRRWKRGVAATVLAALAALLFVVSYYPYQRAQEMANSFEQPFLFHGYLQYPEDMDTYRTFCAQSERGRWFFIHPAFGEPQSGAYFNLLWVVCGKLQALFGYGFAQTIQVLRAGAFLLLVCGFYLILRIVNFGRLQAIIGSLLAMSVSGLGWVSMLPEKLPASLAEQPQTIQTLYRLYFGIGQVFKPFVPAKLPIVPPDLYTEIAPFVQGAWVPHVGISIGLLLVAVYFLLRYRLRGNKMRELYIATALGIAATLIRPYEGLAFLGAYLVIVVPVWWQQRHTNRRQAWQVLAPLGALAVALGYYAWLFRIHPLWRTWGAGNRYPAPPFGVFHVAFFWSFWVAVLFVISKALKAVFKRKPKEPPYSAQAQRALLWWAAVQLGLLYSGISFAWRTAAALGGLLALIFAMVLLFVWTNLASKIAVWLRYPLGGVVLVLALFVVSVSNVHAYFEKLQIAERFNRYYFIEKVVNDAMIWAGENLPEGAVVLTHGHYGLKLPAYGDLRPILWHKDLTPNFKTRKSDYFAFANSDIPEHRERVLGYYGVEFVFWGPLDKKWSKFPQLDGLEFLERIYDNGFVQIYRVIKEKIRYTSLPAHLR